VFEQHPNASVSINTPTSATYIVTESERVFWEIDALFAELEVVSLGYEPLRWILEYTGSV
jgi:hypothetical protein